MEGLQDNNIYKDQQLFMSTQHHDPVEEWLLRGFNRTLVTDNFLFVPKKERNWTVFLLLIIVLAAIVGNLLVCLAVYWKRKLRNMFNYFLVSLALSDMMSAVLIMPLSIVKISVDDLPVPKMICVTWYSLDVLFTSSTICHLCMISVDRYLTLTYPLRYGHSKKKKHTLLKIALVWIVSICIAGPLFILTMLDSDVDHSTDRTSPEDNVLLKGCGPETPIFVISATVISFYLPLLIMTVMYALTVRALQVQLKERRRIAVTETSNTRHFNNDSKKSSLSSGLYLSPSLKRIVFPDRRKTSAPVLPLVMIRDQQKKLSTVMNQHASLHPSLYNKRSFQIGNGEKPGGSILSPQSNAHQDFHSSPETEVSRGSKRWKKNFFNDRRTAAKGQRNCRPLDMMETSDQPSPHMPRYLVTSISPGHEWNACTTIDDGNLFRSDSLSADHSLSMLLPTHESKFSSFISTANLASTSPKTRQSSYFDGSKTRRFGLDCKSFSSSFRRRSSISSSTNGSVRRVHGGLDRGRRAVQVLGILFVVFLFCYLPFFAIYVIRGTCSRCRPYLPTSILTVLEWVAYSAALFNPIIYHIFNPDFRRAFQQLLRCHCFYQTDDRCRGHKDVKSIPMEGSTSSTPLRSRKMANYGTNGEYAAGGCGVCVGRKQKSRQRLELPTCRVEAV